MENQVRIELMIDNLVAWFANYYTTQISCVCYGTTNYNVPGSQMKKSGRKSL